MVNMNMINNMVGMNMTTNINTDNWKYCPVCLVRTEHKDGQCTSKFHQQAIKIFGIVDKKTGEKDD